MLPGRRAALRAMALCWAAGLPTLAAAQASCPPDSLPPVVPAGLLSPGTDWTQMAAFFSQQNIRFVHTTAAQTVIPCRRKGGGYCAPMVGQVLSEQRTFCLSRAMAGDGQLRFSGAVVRVSGDDPSQVHLGFGGQNATDSVYLLVRANQSITMFRGKNDKVMVIRQNVPQDSGWLFAFHDDSVFTSPQAEWRGEGSRTSMLRPRARPPVRGGGPTDLFGADEGEAAQGGTSFAWMACASGCCQFHGLPAGGGDDDDDDVDHPQGPPKHRPPHRPRMHVQKDGGPR
ncbi:MAG TPA: hypothetical protein VEX86_16440 [Longimicrobium sp.]|nr:hypothetical protein [Longimicrobium sp.]